MRRTIAIAASLVSLAVLVPPVAAAPIPAQSQAASDVLMLDVQYRRDRDWRRDRRPRDCHRDVRRHFVPGYGRVPHRHVGPRCRVDVGRRDRYRGRDCIRIGDLRICT